MDLLRGVVMIVMALDHGRDFFPSAAMCGSPTDLATTRNVCSKHLPLFIGSKRDVALAEDMLRAHE